MVKTLTKIEDWEEGTRFFKLTDKDGTVYIITMTEGELSIWEEC